MEFRRERYKAAPEARPRDGASKSREFTEGNWESKFWKRLSKKGKGLLNWLLRTTSNAVRLGLSRRRLHVRRWWTWNGLRWRIGRVWCGGDGEFR